MWPAPEAPVEFSMIFEAQTHDTSRKAELQRPAEAGADEIMFLIQMGTVPQWAALDTIRNLGRRVLPHFRGRH